MEFFSHCCLLPANCGELAGLLSPDKEGKQGQGCMEETVAYSFHPFEPAARLHYVIEAVRLRAFQLLGRVFQAPFYREDFSSYRKALLAGIHLPMLAPSPG